MNRAKHSGAANLCARAYALALIFFLVVLLLAPRAWGNWTVNGVQLRSPNGHQSRPAICSDGSGGMYAAFRSDAQLLAQHLGPTGDLLWNWDGIAVKNVAGNVGRAVVVPTGNGEVIIAWADYRTATGISTLSA